jgi:short-subunit dehydrogenase
MIEVYLDGLTHRIANTKIKVTIVKPGPTSTPMTEALKKEGASLASVSHVSRDIVKAIKNGKRVVYTPIKWSLIMIIVRNIPNWLFKKINI